MFELILTKPEFILDLFEKSSLFEKLSKSIIYIKMNSLGKNPLIVLHYIEYLTSIAQVNLENRKNGIVHIIRLLPLEFSCYRY